MKSKAQIGIEFVIIIGAVMFFMVIFFLAVQNSTEEKLYQRENTIVKEIALTVQNEIILATNSIDGYKRTFELPQKAGNMEYEITLQDEVVYIKTLNGKHSLALPITNVTGQINITENTIQKINGAVYLNT